MTGIVVIALFGVAGAAVATGRLGLFFREESPPASASTPSPTRSATGTPTPAPTSTPTPTTPPAPVSAADTPCATNTTMSVWAHYDDDLIFSSPTLQHAFDAGDCIRTLFLTGSDAGRGMDYSKNRELGILRAYNTMRGQQGFWSEKSVTLLSGAVLSQWSPDGDPHITVAFLRLPDGNLTADGFPSTGNVSMPQLLNGTIGSISPISGAPALTAESLTATIAELTTAYHAGRLITHVPGAASQLTSGDHPDHAATGAFTRAAWQRAGLPASQVSYAVGYPSETLPVNVSGADLDRKLAAYRVYAAQDPVVKCDTDAACLAKHRFGDWLQRSYLMSDADLFPNG